MIEHTVTFLSPGTFVSESTERPIDSWDVAKACAMARDIRERYSAKPYAFRFTTYTTAPDVPDGEGGMLKVERREKESSGLFVLGGVVRPYETISSKEEQILKDSMRCNDEPLLFENTNSYRFTYFFTDKDKIVNPDNGEVMHDGAHPRFVDYRKQVREQWAAQNALKGDGT